MCLINASEYPLENRHMEKLKPGLQKAQLLIEKLSSIFHLQNYAKKMPAGVQPVADGIADHHRGEREGSEEEERKAEAYPWQCFLFMERILGLDG